jgi:N-acetylneuraminic acid mutarotase
MHKSAFLMLALAILTSTFIITAKTTQSSTNVEENSWATMQSLPEPLSGVAVTVGEKIYIFSGWSYTTHLFVYDTQSQTLNESASMPTHRTRFGVAVVDHKIYTIGGQHYYKKPDDPAVYGHPANVTEVYDTRTDTWETKQPAIDYSSQLHANTVNGKIYAMYYGGRYVGSNMTGTGSNVDVYDPETDTWTRISAFPQEVSGPSDSCVIDDKIYIIIDTASASRIGEGKLHIYDTTTDTWSTGANLPTYYKQSRMVATTGEHAPKQIYIVGGAIWGGSAFGDFEAFNATFSYDPVSDSWSRAADMPTARQSAAVAVVDDKICALGGGIQAYWLYPSQTGAVEVYTPFGYGTIPPVIDVVSAVNQTYNASSVSLDFMLNKPVVWMGYSLDGQDNVTVTGNTTLSGLTNGLHNITVYAKDEFENTGTSETISFSIEAPFPITLAVTSVAIAAVVGVSLLVYFKKRKH